MFGFELQTAFGLIVVALPIALIALYSLAQIQALTAQKASVFLQEAPDPVVFLFDDEELVNATPQAQLVLNAAMRQGSDWVRLLSILLPRFPEIRDQIADLAERGKMEIMSRDGSAVVLAEWRNGLARISLIDRETNDEKAKLDGHSIAAMERELETLRATAEHAPFLVWRESADGAVIWANNAFLEMADLMDPDAIVPAWPPKRLFDTSPMTQLADPSASRRMSLTLPGSDEVMWFECTRQSLGSDNLYTATKANRVVKAESELRDFVQTLTKTFAQLDIGLAIFDKNRQLALFNPALADLTSLPPEFLIVRPTLSSFLDRLREKRVMPEPKDYKSWRQQIAELEVAATNGDYEEVWSLPSNQTYRVTGRPHPDGAIAFLIEDITNEVSASRRFRAELETGQAVIDTMDEAIAVFSASGTLTMANIAYSSLWGSDPSETVSETRIQNASQVWQEKCAPTPIWTEARDFIGAFGDRHEWRAETRLWDGRRLACRFTPLPGGATLVGFTPITSTITSSPARRNLTVSALGM